MVAGFILLIHLIFLIYVFLINKKEGISEGLLAVAFVFIIFAVGWTIATIITNLVFSIKFFYEWYWQPLDSWILLRIRKELNRDTISLLMLTFAETIIYLKFFPMKKEGPLQK